MIEWIEVNSSRASAVAYDAEGEAIYVRFPNGAVYRYEACTKQDWSGLTAPGVSIGRFIEEVLNKHPYRRANG
jgi:hypothetical protein